MNVSRILDPTPVVFGCYGKEFVSSLEEMLSQHFACYLARIFKRQKKKTMLGVIKFHLARLCVDVVNEYIYMRDIK